MALLTLLVLWTCISNAAVNCECQWPGSPTHGRVTCPSGVGEGARCKYECDSGFIIAGPRQTRCHGDKNGRKSVFKPPETPTCVVRGPEKCYPSIPAPADGAVECVYFDVEGNSAGDSQGKFIATCTFTCNGNFSIRGSHTSSCEKSGRWTDPQPRCVRPLCGPFPDAENRTDICTDGHLAGSICFFFCPPGYRVIGASETTCEKTTSTDWLGYGMAAEWSNDPPICVRLTCDPPQVAPVNGNVKCTEENYEQSVCVFRCNEGFKMFDSVLSFRVLVCIDDKDDDASGTWVGRKPVCVPLDL